MSEKDREESEERGEFWSEHLNIPKIRQKQDFSLNVGPEDLLVQTLHFVCLETNFMMDEDHPLVLF